MELLIFFGVYEAERPIAGPTLSRLVDILEDHRLSVLILDDASPSHLGTELADLVRDRVAAVDVIRTPGSTGYHGAIERTFSTFEYLTEPGRPTYDYLLRVDADTHFCRRDLADLFEPGVLPRTGMIGTTFRMRWRDLVQVFSDILPAGFRRRVRNDVREHAWEFSRRRPVWWWQLGLLAVLRGFRGIIAPGNFQVIAWETLLALRSAGRLTSRRKDLGLVFGEDVLTCLAVRSVGHPVLHARSFVPDWDVETFATSYLAEHTVAELVSRRPYLVHPLKATPDAHALRLELDATLGYAS